MKLRIGFFVVLVAALAACKDEREVHATQHECRVEGHSDAYCEKLYGPPVPAPTPELQPVERAPSDSYDGPTIAVSPSGRVGIGLNSGPTVMIDGGIGLGL